MSPVRILIVVVAAIAAIGLAFVMRGALGGKPAPVAPVEVAEKPSTRVLVAKRDLGVGERLQTSDLGWQDWPADALNPSFITDGAPPTTAAEKPKGVEKAAAAAGEMIGGTTPMQAWVGALVREPILTGEPLVPRKLVRMGEGGFMSVVLAPGKRAVSVPITVESGAGGFILPGDRVDVLHSSEAQSGGESGAAAAGAKVVVNTVLTNVRVLAIDQNAVAQKEAKSLIGSSATLEVADEDAEALMRAKAEGNLVLALRPLAESGAMAGDAARRRRDTNLVRVHRAGATQTVGVSQ